MVQAPTATAAGANRVGWADYGKGMCILFVVMMHATFGVEHAMGREGFVHTAIDFMTPFRIPDFFLLSGLFVSRVIDRDWREVIDRKVVHFLYFLLMWAGIAFLVKEVATGQASLMQLPIAMLGSIIDPPGTLWFIQMLPIFFLVAKATRRLPMALVPGTAAVLEMVHIDTGIFVVDQFSARLVFFLVGWRFSEQIFALAAWAQAHVGIALAALAVWALVNASAVELGVSAWPVISLVLALMGAIAVVTAAALMAKWDRVFAPLRYCGRNTLVIYLAFFLFMASSRVVLVRFSPITDPGVISLLVTAIAVVGPLLLNWAVRNTPAKFLFVRPQALKRAGTTRLQPAE